MLTGKVHSAEDGQLLAEMHNGSGDAFKALYEKYWADVLDEAFKRLADADLAKDVVQEVFTYLWTKAGSLEIKNLPAWLNTVVKNQVFQAMRKQERFVPLTDLFAELESHTEASDALLLRKELVSTYEALIASLPEQQRIIFNLRYRENMSPDEIAQKLNISPKTVRNHLGRALNKLKAAFLLINLLMFISGK
uniref:RNA polymerase sigma factor n=1 Tax=Pedobacter schmidteae TaxID=2201271 RepID=UPI000EAD3340|nr:RNA polymerase sigma-70 factor [Pedobacter schmidteae]